MVKPANFDAEHADALGGSTAVIADEIAAEAVAVHGADVDSAHQATGIALLDQGSVRHWPMLALSSGVSNAGRLAATNVEAAIAEIAGGLGMSDVPVRHWPMLALSSGAGPGVVPHLSKPDAHDAGNISIVDAGGYFAATDVENALQALGQSGGAALPGVEGGYAPLSSGLLVPVGYMGSGTADSTKFLRGDGTWAVPAGGGGGGAFEPPGDVDGIYSWFKADAISGLSDGAAVDGWPNSVTGVGFDLIGVTSPVYKTNILNSLPVVRLASSAYFRMVSLALQAPGFSVFVVCKFSALSNAYTGVVGFAWSDAGGIFVKSNGKSAVYPGSGTAYDGTGSATYDTTNWNYMTAVFGPSTYLTRRNGAADASGVSWGFPVLYQHGFIGNQAVGSRIMAGDIAEVLIYSRPLTSSEITTIESYITTKYAL